MSDRAAFVSGQAGDRAARTQTEQTILLVTAAGCVLGGALVFAASMGWKFKLCAWKALTGLPCAGCGTTRSMLCLTHGQWGEALALNPGAVLGAALWAALSVYAAAVLLFRLEPWRPAWFTARRGCWLVAGALAVNWGYLIAAARV